MPHRVKVEQTDIEDEAVQSNTGQPDVKEGKPQQIADLEEKVSAAQDRVLRMQAEMENVRRRAERDVESAHKFALERFVNELLPIVDGLERALLAHSGEDSATGSLLDGVGLTLKMLHGVFNKVGVHQVNPEGTAFNPEHHQAVSTASRPDLAAGTVVEVLQKGYLLNDRLVRPALVIVAGN